MVATSGNFNLRTIGIDIFDLEGRAKMGLISYLICFYFHKGEDRSWNWNFQFHSVQNWFQNWSKWGKQYLKSEIPVWDMWNRKLWFQKTKKVGIALELISKSVSALQGNPNSGNKKFWFEPFEIDFSQRRRSDGDFSSYLKLKFHTKT